MMIPFEIERQPDPVTCGATCLHGLYRSTYLYREARVVAETNEQDDIRGTPEGHFVVICGCDARTVRVADPYHPNALGTNPVYEVPMDRMLNAILLAIVTYDANLVVLRPPEFRAE